jgi:hypothetical protein
MFPEHSESSQGAKQTIKLKWLSADRRGYFITGSGSVGYLICYAQHRCHMESLGYLKSLYQPAKFIYGLFHCKAMIILLRGLSIVAHGY